MTYKPHWARGVAMGILMGGLVSAPVLADSSKAAATATVDKDADQFITLTTENDKYFGNTDGHYTNGAQATYTVLKDTPSDWVNWAGEKLPFLNVGGKTAMSYSFGQQIYTPDYAEPVNPQIGDMPFAGFLYGKAGFTTFDEAKTDSYELTVGMVGPSAQGEFVQQTYHEAFDYYKPKGWKNYQLSDEPIVNLSWLRRHPGYKAWDYKVLGSDWFADVEPRYGFAAGNAHTYANAGGTFRFGPAAAQGADTTGLMVPGLPGTGIFSKTGEAITWYGFVGFDTRLVARNIFLDGNTFRSGPHVEKIPLVADGSAGLVVLTGPLKATVAINQRTREFESQRASDVFGSLTVGYRF